MAKSEKPWALRRPKPYKQMPILVSHYNEALHHYLLKDTVSQLSVAWVDSLIQKQTKQVQYYVSLLGQLSQIILALYVWVWILYPEMKKH